MPDIIAIAIRLGLYLDLMLLFGLPMFGLYTLRGTERASGSVLATIALAGIGLSILGMIALAASMGGVPVDQVDRATVNLLISGTAIGAVWQVRMAALLLVLYFSIVGWRRPAFALWSVSVTAAIALATLAWTGHGAADEGGDGSILAPTSPICWPQAYGLEHYLPCACSFFAQRPAWRSIISTCLTGRWMASQR